MDNDLISRAALLDIIGNMSTAWEYGKAVTDIYEIIKNQPAVDAAPVRHGRWEEKMEHAGYVCCSVCHDCYVEKGWIFNKKWAWCPQCGARMDGGENNA